MEQKKVTIKNEEKSGLNKLLNPIVKPKKESNLEEILKEIEEEDVTIDNLQLTIDN